MARKANFKFTDKRHAKRGIASMVLAVLSLAVFGGLIFVSFRMKGNGGVYIGSLGLTALIMNFVGLYEGIISFRETDKYYLFSKLGSILNVIIMVVWVSVFLMGI